MRPCLLILCTAIIASIGISQAADSKSATVEVNISGLEFRPAQVKIHIGQTVQWTNKDDRDHTVVANDGTFQSGNIKSGQTYNFTFKKAGKFSYGCNYHPRMKGIVIVE